MGSDELPLDSALRLLSHAHRRALVGCLDDHEDPLALADAAEDVAAQESGEPIPELSPEDVERVYLALYHSHVPKLSEDDIVAYDRERDTVALTDRGQQLAAFRHYFSGDSDLSTIP